MSKASDEAWLTGEVEELASLNVTLEVKDITAPSLKGPAAHWEHGTCHLYLRSACIWNSKSAAPQLGWRHSSHHSDDRAAGFVPDS